MRFSRLPFCPSPFSARLLQCRLQYFLLHIKPPWNSGDGFIAEIRFLPRIALINAAHHQVHFNSTQECYTLSQKNPERTTASSCHDGDALLATSAPFARSILIDLLGITNLLCLSPNKLRMPIYLINEMAFPPFTSNNTKCCTHPISPSDQLSSPMDSSLSHMLRLMCMLVCIYRKKKKKYVLLHSYNTVLCINGFK